MKCSQAIEIIAQQLFGNTDLGFQAQEELASDILKDLEKAGMAPPKAMLPGTP